MSGDVPGDPQDLGSHRATFGWDHGRLKALMTTATQSHIHPPANMTPKMVRGLSHSLSLTHIIKANSPGMANQTTAQLRLYCGLCCFDSSSAVNMTLLNVDIR